MILTYFSLTCVACPPQVTAVWTCSVQWMAWHGILTLSTDFLAASTVRTSCTHWGYKSVYGQNALTQK